MLVWGFAKLLSRARDQRDVERNLRLRASIVFLTEGGGICSEEGVLLFSKERHCRLHASRIAVQDQERMH